MSENIAQDRSPRSPSLSLADSIALTAKLFDAIRSATVGPDIAVKPLGYGGTNGAAMSTLATLAQYGLIDRSGGKVTVTPLGVRILHPKGDEQLEASIREAALAPKVMKELYDGYLDCAETVITGHLIQTGFNADRAKRLAAIHVANKAFAKLGAQEKEVHNADDTAASIGKKEPALTSGVTAIPSPLPTVHVQAPVAQAAVTSPVGTTNTVLAQYTIPLGSNQATLVFTGQELSTDDFDALIDFVQFSKRQFDRAKKNARTASPEPAPISDQSKQSV